MIEIIRSGLYTTVQDYPGRVGYWNVGIPPSGPMDSLSFRIANHLVGNSDGAAGLEMTILGPKLRFEREALVAFTGATLKGTLNGRAVPWWETVYVDRDSVLDLGAVDGPGCRAYMAVRGGIEVPDYLGSKSTFPKGSFGGHEASPLLGKGTRIPFRDSDRGAGRVCRVEPERRPLLAREWRIGAVLGPHAAPDYFTRETVEAFFDTNWIVHQDSNRLGYRLEGPAPRFAREDGGEGGSHPSNLIDYPYAVGMVNFTGNLPVILTVDGPSLGGFISMVTIPTHELWKVGQAKPGNRIRFEKISLEAAVNGRRAQEQMLRDLVVDA
ncbi:MAG: 5-oxoprolinase/urea amidolyase family protein [Anaerolineales bacterium]|nr:5-oxoprolinase/urea amidolyase family protein [Anaerolineales bacterium]